MTLTRRLLIVAASALLATITVVLLAGRAGSQPALPAVSAVDLLASVAEALQSDPTVSGDVEVRADLGLPELPQELLGNAADGTAPLSAIAGDRRLRVERSPDGVRLAELTDDGERAFISNGSDAWLWNSADMTAVHVQVPAEGDHQAPQESIDPLDIARRALEAVSETTEVEVVRTERVAGRDVYTLTLVPQDDETLVERIEMAIDAERRLPLAIRAFGAAQSPALSSGFTSVDFAAIDPARFAFTPPDGATVSEPSLPPDPGNGWKPDLEGARPERIGEGWSQVVALPLPAQAPQDDNQAADVLPFQGTLLSATEVTVDGTHYLLVGAVPLANLEAAADTLR